MKKLHLTCDEYINYDKKIDLHNFNYSNHSIFDSLDNLKHLIIYGPNGIGKYTQALQIIKKFSEKNLKYERKISFEFNKDMYNFILSDIHIEVDFDMLGCQSKLLWHEIYTKYVDILMSKTNKTGIILCKNFQNIHGEMHEIFASYMNNNNINNKFEIKFIILTNSVSFINNNILTHSYILSFSRPTKTNYQKLTKNKILNKVNNINNIKNLKMNILDNEPHVKLCDQLADYLLDYNNFDIYTLREYLYNILTYNLDIYNCIWYINNKLNKIKNIKENIHKIIMRTISFLKLYNNNYRPIYHLENYFIYLFNILHNIQKSN